MKIGMLGGSAGIDRGLLPAPYKAYQENFGPDDYPEIVINASNDGHAVVVQEQIGTTCRYAVNAVHTLARAARILLFSSTRAYCFREVGDVSIPLLSIVKRQTGSREARAQRAGLLGTIFTMRSSFYQENFKRAVELVVRTGGTEVIQESCFRKLSGVFLEDTRAGLLKIVQS
jgi:aspartate racemase